MKKITFILAIACTGLAITSCKKENPSPPVIVTPTASGLSAFFDDNVADAEQHFTVNVSSGALITGAKGTRITIFAGSLLNASNQAVTGTVDVTLIEVYDRASMVLLNKATVGKLPNGDLSTLVSGGEYYLKITQNGQELHANPGVLVSMPVENTGEADFGMSVFNGINAADDLVWELTGDDVAVVEDTTGQGGGGSVSYQILDGEWGWTNVDRFYSDPRPKTLLRAQLPEGFDNTNCEVFITYDGEPTALASLDVFTTDGFFSEHYGLIPIGLEVHFIAVTIIDGQLNYAIQGATIADQHIEHITSFTPISQAALAVLINDLP